MSQNAPYTETLTPVTPYKFGAFDQYLSFCATGGLITSDDGQLSKMTTSQFCQQWGVDRKTAYRWRQTPGFADKVRARREEIFPLARETACWNRLYLIGMTSLGANGHGDQRAAVQALTLFLGHFGGLRLPARRNEPSGHNSWNLAELFVAAEKELANDS